MTNHRYTWDQAEILGAWPPAAFQAVGIKPATIRKWASRGAIDAVGTGPNGCNLYSYEQVIQHAQRNTPAVLVQHAHLCHTKNAHRTGVSSSRKTA